MLSAFLCRGHGSQGCFLEEVRPEQVHEQWIELGGRPTDDAKVKLVGGPLFEVVITCFTLGSKAPQMLDGVEILSSRVLLTVVGG